MSKIPSSTKVVVIGGGVTGTSCAYHIAKFGWKDTILRGSKKRSYNFHRDNFKSRTWRTIQKRCNEKTC